MACVRLLSCLRAYGGPGCEAWRITQESSVDGLAPHGSTLLKGRDAQNRAYGERGSRYALSRYSTTRELRATRPARGGLELVRGEPGSQVRGELLGALHARQVRRVGEAQPLRLGQAGHQQLVAELRFGDIQIANDHEHRHGDLVQPAHG